MVMEIPAPTYSDDSASSPIAHPRSLLAGMRVLRNVLPLWVSERRAISARFYPRNLRASCFVSNFAADRRPSSFSKYT
jgi:hypothetical protein